MAVTLFSTRIVFKSLGTEDFGIFNLIAGVIAMLSFLNGAMTVTTQRYLSFHLGKGEKERNKVVFKNSVALHLIIGLILVIVLEVLGLILFDGFLNLPPNRIGEAKLVYHFMVLSTFFTINAVPYDAAINANEDMFFDSISGIFEAILKLAIAYYLLISSFDRLITYSVLIAGLTILIRIIKSIWCYSKYEECRIKLDFSFDKSMLKEMSSYAGWSLFGAMSYVGGTQGVAVILNLFFGAKINASYGIANQVNSQLQSFSVMMVKAFNPQIVKSEGAGNRDRMMRLSVQSSKFSTFLLLMMVIPMVLELHYILKLWLQNVPDYTIVFCTIILFNALVTQMSTGLKTMVQAIGKIALYQSFLGITNLLILPISFLLLKLGYPPQSVLVASLLIEFVSFFLRLYIVRRISNMQIQLFLKEVFLKVFLIAISCILLTYVFQQLFQETFLRVVLVVIFNTIIAAVMIWFYGLKSFERDILKTMFNNVKALVRKKIK